MDIHTNIPLKNYLTMRLGGAARFMTDVHSVEDVQHIVAAAKQQNLPIFILGGGSNLIARDETYNGIVVRNRIQGFEVLTDNMSTVTIKVGAGEVWDDIVARTVDMNLTGLEAMSAIPGTFGAAPVQNVGAYGQEIADTLDSLEAFDTTTQQIVTLTNEQCKFSYRDSIFRAEEFGRYIILNVTVTLYKSMPSPPFYKGLQDYFDEHNITLFTPRAVREAVTEIRAEKLPDPKDKPNAGSFFKNAIIEDWQLQEFLQKFPDAPNYDMGDGRFKVPTGWLLDNLGLKDKLLYGMRVNKANALVLINEAATGYADLAHARDEIAAQVRDTYQINIEQEPIELH